VLRPGRLAGSTQIPTIAIQVAHAMVGYNGIRFNRRGLEPNSNQRFMTRPVETAVMMPSANMPSKIPAKYK